MEPRVKGSFPTRDTPFWGGKGMGCRDETSGMKGAMQREGRMLIESGSCWAGKPIGYDKTDEKERMLEPPRRVVLEERVSRSAV